MNIKTIVVAALAVGGALGAWAEETVTYAAVRRDLDAQRVNVVEFTAKAETTAVVEAKVAGVWKQVATCENPSGRTVLRLSETVVASEWRVRAADGGRLLPVVGLKLYRIDFREGGAK